MGTRTLTYESGGLTFYGEVMTIESATIQLYGDGVAVDLMFVAPGSGQGSGGYAVDGPRLIEWVRGVTAVAGVEDWGSLRGRPVVVLRGERGGLIDGILSLQEDDKVFWFRKERTS